MVYTHSFTGSKVPSREPVRIPPEVTQILLKNHNLSPKPARRKSKYDPLLPPEHYLAISSSSSSSSSTSTSSSFSSLSLLPPAPEIVVFCEPPQLWKGLGRLLLRAFMFAIPNVWIAVVAVKYLTDFLPKYQEYILVVVACLALCLEVSLVLGWLYRHRFDVFGFRVVTNSRAALIIPHRKFIAPAGIISVAFRETMEKLARDELLSFLKGSKNKLKLLPSMKMQAKHSFLAELKYGKERSGRGDAVILGAAGEKLAYEDVNICMLEEAIISAMLQVMEQKIEQNFEMRTTCTQVPSRIVMASYLILPLLADGVLAYYTVSFIWPDLLSTLFLATVGATITCACIRQGGVLVEWTKAIQTQRVVRLGNFGKTSS